MALTPGSAPCIVALTPGSGVAFTPRSAVALTPRSAVALTPGSAPCCVAFAPGGAPGWSSFSTCSTSSASLDATPGSERDRINLFPTTYE